MKTVVYPVASRTAASRFCRDTARRYWSDLLLAADLNWTRAIAVFLNQTEDWVQKPSTLGPERAWMLGYAIQHRDDLEAKAAALVRERETLPLPMAR